MVVVGKKRVLKMRFGTLVAELREAFAAMAVSQPAVGRQK
jgi:hypothetical protein